jgi:hypothetical protein
VSRRRCIECDRLLFPSEQGALCSECYFALITDPALANPQSWAQAAPAPVPERP